MEVIIKPDAEAVGRLSAKIVANQLRRKPGSVLGLASGGTMLPLYQELVRLHREEGLDFSRSTAFNLDEYLGLPPQHPSSYRSFMQDHLFRHINLPPSSRHLPDGLAEDLPAACRRYEQRIAAAGGIDLQVLGVGRDGHIGFNEPSSSLSSRTRVKTLTQQTIQDNARYFRDGESVPIHVITMGIGTILESRKCLLMAFGAAKADAIASAVEGPVTASVPASALQMHPDVTAVVDSSAAARLNQADYYRWVYEGKPESLRID